MNPKPFTFEISLSILNHLGRNLYRSFATVLGEAVSNAWDADASNVWISIDTQNNGLLVKDDGIGMTVDDFQGKFLKVGYSKRKEGNSRSSKGRPYIGRKGIGKLALLSCAEVITVISKTASMSEYTGGTINNSGLNDAILEDLSPSEYQLESWSPTLFEGDMVGHTQGTMVYFQNISEGIQNNPENLKKILALYFRFSLLDSSFNIHFNGEKITEAHLSSLAKKTEFLWKINEANDPYVANQLGNVKESEKLEIDERVGGFIASVEKPSNLKFIEGDEKAGIDLFVNGRLRERNILKHMPLFSTRHIASYLYGQIHFNILDEGETDRFTTSRESIVADDPQYEELLTILKDNVLELVSQKWDEWRRKHKLDGDPDNQSLTPRERKAEELYNAVTEDFKLPRGAEYAEKVKQWDKDLMDDARFNLTSYAECFVSENLVRKYISDQGFTLPSSAVSRAQHWKEKETENKAEGNISIQIRQDNSDIFFLDMDDLSKVVDPGKDKIKDNSLTRDAAEYKPIRNAVGHTGLLTEDAKRKLTSVYENIKGRIRTLLGDQPPTPTMFD